MFGEFVKPPFHQSIHQTYQYQPLLGTGTRSYFVGHAQLWLVITCYNLVWLVVNGDSMVMNDYEWLLMDY
jgi:hypothetical protein